MTIFYFLALSQFFPAPQDRIIETIAYGKYLRIGHHRFEIPKSPRQVCFTKNGGINYVKEF